jgi:hypothetical protein
MRPDFSLEWESIKFTGITNSREVVFRFFGKPEKTALSDTVIFKTVNSFEEENIFWKKSTAFFTTDYCYTGQNSYLLKPGKYSTVLEIKLDTLPYGILKIDASSFVFTQSVDKAVLVLAIDNKQGTILWQGADLFKDIIDKNAWNYIVNKTEYNNTLQQEAYLKVYIWNTGENDLYIDDFKVQIKK